MELRSERILSRRYVPSSRIPSISGPSSLFISFCLQFNINVVGTVTTTNLFLPLLRNGKLKKVICISSAAADADFTRKTEHERIVPYSVSKAALNMAVVKYALERRNREEGFTFLALAPGAVDTREMEGVTDPKREFVSPLL